MADDFDGDGPLRPEVGFHQIFRALFPCGSVTGAPKVRAMQLLAELEEEPRGIYTGAIGFFSQKQTVFNVAIRTLELEDGQGKMGIGSGIVIDSVAADEFSECRLKAAFLSRPSDSFAQQFSLVETLLWQDGYPLIELHLDRARGFSALLRIRIRSRRHKTSAPGPRRGDPRQEAAKSEAAAGPRRSCCTWNTKFCRKAHQRRKYVRVSLRSEPTRMTRCSFTKLRTGPSMGMPLKRR